MSRETTLVVYNSPEDNPTSTIFHEGTLPCVGEVPTIGSRLDITWPRDEKGRREFTQGEVVAVEYRYEAALREKVSEQERKEFASYASTDFEPKSNPSRISQATNLILQLPKDHDGRNTWLMNYSDCDEGVILRTNNDMVWDPDTKSAVPA